ncbi:hypothetical protein HCJ92_03245, partial [Streptomyces sp. ventii]|nr:hypothetical protein [Streptomyces spiramenti]
MPGTREAARAERRHDRTPEQPCRAGGPPPPRGNHAEGGDGPPQLTRYAVAARALDRTSLVTAPARPLIASRSVPGTVRLPPPRNGTLPRPGSAPTAGRLRGAPAPSPGMPSRRADSGPGLDPDHGTAAVRPGPEWRGLAHAAARLDGPALEQLLDLALQRHGLIAAWEEVIAPALHTVGRKWAVEGEPYVGVEHLLSWHVSSAFRRRRTAPPRPGAAPTLLTCVADEHHTLPIEALAAALGERGVPTRVFGAAMPAEALLGAVRRLGPAAVVLWAQSRETADRALVAIGLGYLSLDRETTSLSGGESQRIKMVRHL